MCVCLFWTVCSCVNPCVTASVDKVHDMTQAVVCTFFGAESMKGIPILTPVYMYSNVPHTRSNLVISRTFLMNQGMIPAYFDALSAVLALDRPWGVRNVHVGFLVGPVRGSS